MIKHKRHKRSVSVLIVPDDKGEPITFTLSNRRVQWLKVGAVLLGFHVLLGFVGYWRYTVVHGENQKLTVANQELKESTARIAQLSAELAALEESHNKIRAALGIGVETRKGGTHGAPAREAMTRSPQVATGGPEYPPQTERTDRAMAFFEDTGGKAHDYARNLPTLLPVQGYLSARFSQTPDEKGKTHPGIDLVADAGTPIRAAADGIVAFAGWTHDLGNMVLLYHGGGFFTLYGHARQLLVSSRDFVRKGDYIALLGSSGESSGPHLHFEIWKDGVAVDPRDYLLALKD
ncbi:MAG: peptidoglycan DD-metalloendopeptidase family protein [candidate division KSB1 bacterium]|nr:peptidoglycan DD-metalloendopeptidase family protein [candidate division KSB1 bacterium]